MAGYSIGGRHALPCMNEHTHIIKIYFIGPLDSYYIMGYSPEKYANNL